MLQKVYVSVGLYAEEYRSRAIVLQVDSLEEFLATEKILKNHIHKFKCIQLKSALFSTLSLAELGSATAFSILLEDVEHLSVIIDRCSQKYLELIVPYELFSEGLFKKCELVNRVIVSFQSEEELLKLNDIFKAFISWRRFPLIENVPFCKVDIRDVKHLSEVYMRRVGVDEKPNECKICLLQKYCAFRGEGFVPVPILNSPMNCEKYVGVLEFLSHEDFISRF